MMAIPDSQRYPWNRYLINNMEDIVVFLSLKVFNFDNSVEMCKSLKLRNQKMVFNMINNLYLNQTKLLRELLSDIAIFPCRITWNYAYSLFNSCLRIVYLQVLVCRPWGSRDQYPSSWTARVRRSSRRTLRN